MSVQFIHMEKSKLHPKGGNCNTPEASKFWSGKNQSVCSAICLLSLTNIPSSVHLSHLPGSLLGFSVVQCMKSLNALTALWINSQFPGLAQTSLLRTHPLPLPLLVELQPPSGNYTFLDKLPYAWAFAQTVPFARNILLSLILTSGPSPTPFCWVSLTVLLRFHLRCCLLQEALLTSSLVSISTYCTLNLNAWPLGDKT